MKLPPQTGSMLSRTLARLLRAERITHLSFQTDVHTYRLAVYIEQLRNKYGWPIVGEPRTRPTNDPVGRKARYFVYYLPVSALMEAGPRGREYALKIFEWERMRSEGKAVTSPSESNAIRQNNITTSYAITAKDGDKPDGID